MKIIAIIGYKKSGKTSLVLDVINALKRRGRVGSIKNMVHHAIDSVGTDTASHFAAGADTTIGIASDGMLIRTNDAGLGYAIDLLAGQGMDYAIVEGAKESGLAKIAIGEVDAQNIVYRIPAVSRKSDADNNNDSNYCMENIIDIIESQPHYHTLNSFMGQVRQNPGIKYAGAIGSFTGIVRERDNAGDVGTTHLEFEHYEPVAKAAMERICNELKKREGVVDILMHHNTGIINSGEDIVHIVVAAGHRQQMFPVLSDAIEMLKAEVPIWKKEFTPDGEFWVEQK